MPPSPVASATPVFARADLSRARRATRLQFLNLGIVAGTWGVHVPSVKGQYALDERTLALALLSASVGSLMTLAFAGRVVGKLGARNTTVVAGWTFCLAIGLSLLLPGLWALLPVMLLFGAGESVFDVAINAEGSALEVMSGRGIMSGLHGMFSLGAMVGAGVAGLMLRAGIPSWQQLVGVGLCAAISILISSRGMLESHPAGDGEQAHFAWPKGTLLVIGVLICFGMLAEGVMYNWSVLYMTQELHAPQDRAAMGYVAFAGATAVMRFAGDSVRARVAERRILLSGSALAAIAMALVLVLARPWAALAGYALVGIGLATVVPILYNAATRVPGVSRAAAIASVSSIGYMGFMVGPPIVGGIAHATTLTVAMGVLIIAALVVVIGVRRLPASAMTAPGFGKSSASLDPQFAGN